MPHAGLKPIRLCADDYGLAPGIGVAIRSLLEKKRLTSVSCYTDGRFWPREAEHLVPHRSMVELGLHLTTSEKHLHRLSVNTLFLRRARESVLEDWEKQLKSFRNGVGRDPQYLDGHRHIHHLPGVRKIFTEFYDRHFTNTGVWVRVVAPMRRPRPAVAQWRCFALTLAGAPFRRQLQQSGIPYIESGGYYNFNSSHPYADLFSRMLPALNAHELFVCHPGRVDRALKEVDDLFSPREKELDFFSGPDFPRELSRMGYELSFTHI